jgi:hypothetical protein
VNGENVIDAQCVDHCRKLHPTATPTSTRSHVQAGSGSFGAKPEPAAMNPPSNDGQYPLDVTHLRHRERACKARPIRRFG